MARLRITFGNLVSSSALLMAVSIRFRAWRTLGRLFIDREAVIIGPRRNPLSEQSDPTQKPVAKNSIRSRGAVKGHNVRYVLAFGLAGVIIAFIVVALYSGNLPF